VKGGGKEKRGAKKESPGKTREEEIEGEHWQGKWDRALAREKRTKV